MLQSSVRFLVCGLLIFTGLLLPGQQPLQAAAPAPQQAQSPAAFDCATVTEIPQAECEALVTLYESTDGPNWTNNTGWLTTNTPCSWNGVTCEGGNVSRLDLSGEWGTPNNLTGPIPPEIGNLTALTRLFLDNNQLSGPIPPEIGNLTALQSLVLYNNQLSGPIPPEIGNLTVLTGLGLSNNQLSGSIPLEIGNLTALIGLGLSNNQLGGAIPLEIGNLTALIGLHLNNNQLGGAIPPEIGNLTALEGLYLQNNELSGPIPGEMGNLTYLFFLKLNDNQLSGALPKALTALTQLQTFHFYNTDLCVPPMDTVTEWLAGISDVQGTGVTCKSFFLPDPDGYHFQNGSIVDSSWDLFRATFGADNVEWNVGGVTIRKPLAQTYYHRTYRGTGTQGNCSGMAVSSMLLYQGWADPSDFLAQQGVTQTIALPSPSLTGGNWQWSDVVDLIVRYQGYQQGRQVKAARSGAQSRSLSEALSILKAAIDGDLEDPQYIAITGPHGPQDACAGHALIPYAYTTEDSETHVYVYDSNHPFSTSQYISITESGWHYNHNNSISTWQSGQTCKSGLFNRSSTLSVMSLSAWRQSPEPPWLGGGAVLALNDTAPSGGFQEFVIEDGAGLLIEDAQGQAFGSRGNVLVEDIPGSYVWIPEAVIPDIVYDYPVHYIISSTQILTASIIYSGTTEASLHIFTPGGYVEVLGISTQNQVTDTVRILPDASEVTVRAGSESMGRALKIITTAQDVERVVTIGNFNLSTENLASLDVGTDGSVIRFYSEQEQNAYEIHLTQVGFTSTVFTAIGPAMGGGDLHNIHLNWDRPVTATVEIDYGGNGIVDEIVVLDNQALQSQVFLPLVIRQ